MAGRNEVNGKRPTGLPHVHHPALKSAPRPDPATFDFDIDTALSAVVALEARIPAEAHTAPFLGTEREGNAVLIDADGLFITIGYLIAEAELVTVAATPGHMVEAKVVAYDYDTGFGLVRSTEPPAMKPLPIGSAAALGEHDPVIVAPHGGLALAISAKVESKREFAGYWEYLLDYAVFTAPAHPHWNGAALIDRRGRLVGIGSLHVEDALAEGRSLPGNMFVPIDFLAPIRDALVTLGHAGGPPRPWIGVYLTEALGRIFVSGLSADGPAAAAGVCHGDIVLAINGDPVHRIAEFYRGMWTAGSAGVKIGLRILREDDIVELVVATTSRYRDIGQTRRH